VADDTGQGRGSERDVKNGGVPNECHLAKKTKDVREDAFVRDMYGESERNEDSEFHMSTSRIVSVKIIALSRCSYFVFSPFPILGCRKKSLFFY